MKINFEKRISNYQLAYALENSSKYCVSIGTWSEPKEVVNIRTGLVIGYLFGNNSGNNEFRRCWGFCKKLGKNGRVLKSII